MLALEANVTELDSYTEQRFSEIDQQPAAASQRADEARAYVDELART